MIFYFKLTIKCDFLPQFDSMREKALCFKTDLKRISMIAVPSHHMLLCSLFLGFPAGSNGKESACNAGDPGSIPGLWRSPGEGNGYPLRYSCLGNPMDRGAWLVTAWWISFLRVLTIVIEFILIHNWDVSVCFFKICTHIWKLEPKPCSLYKVIFISLLSWYFYWIFQSWKYNFF